MSQFKHHYIVEDEKTQTRTKLFHKRIGKIKEMDFVNKQKGKLWIRVAAPETLFMTIGIRTLGEKIHVYFTYLSHVSNPVIGWTTLNKFLIAFKPFTNDKKFVQDVRELKNFLLKEEI